MAETENIGTLKQRQLNAAIEQEFRGTYVDWYDYYKDLKRRGITDEKILERFSVLGTPIQAVTLNAWVKLRRRKEVAQ